MFDISLEGNIANFDRVVKLLSNPAPALGEIGGYLERQAKMRFVTQTAPDGSKWAPLSANTLKSKKTEAILREDSALVGSIKFRVKGKKVVVKPSVDYAIFHQLGTKPYTIRPRQKKALYFQTEGGMAFAKEINHPGIPARPFMGFEPGDADAINKILAGYINP
jgi:phage gpG-like protein